LPDEIAVLTSMVEAPAETALARLSDEAVMVDPPPWKILAQSDTIKRTPEICDPTSPISTVSGALSRYCPRRMIELFSAKSATTALRIIAAKPPPMVGWLMPPLSLGALAKYPAALYNMPGVKTPASLIASRDEPFPNSKPRPAIAAERAT